MSEHFDEILPTFWHRVSFWYSFQEETTLYLFLSRRLNVPAPGFTIETSRIYWDFQFTNLTIRICNELLRLVANLKCKQGLNINHLPSSRTIFSSYGRTKIVLYAFGGEYVKILQSEVISCNLCTNSVTSSCCALLSSTVECFLKLSVKPRLMPHESQFCV